MTPPCLGRCTISPICPQETSLIFLICPNLAMLRSKLELRWHYMDLCIKNQIPVHKDQIYKGHSNFMLLVCLDYLPLPNIYNLVTPLSYAYVHQTTVSNNIFFKLFLFSNELVLRLFWQLNSLFLSCSDIFGIQWDNGRNFSSMKWLFVKYLVWNLT